MVDIGVQFEPFFTWVIRPRIMYSPGLRSELGYEMERLGGSRAVVYTDKGLVNAGVAEMVIRELSGSSVAVAGVFDKIIQDARLDIINEGAEFYRASNANCMVVVGGGSVMDTAKAINIMIGGGHMDFSPLAQQAALWDGAKPLPPHIAFPTTAGTGCEVTNAAVILDVAATAKLSVSHPYCNADLAMLDPELTVGLPAKITASTGIDALTHAIEGIVSSSAQPISDALGLHAIRLISRYLPIAVQEPGNIEARGYMLIASTIAGMCFVNALTGAVHATAHALGAVYGIPHGLANAIMLPAVMELNIEEKPEKYVWIADAMGVSTGGKSGQDAAMESVRAVRDLKALIGLSDTLKDFGVPSERDKLAPVIDLAAGDAQITYNPRYLEDEDIYKLILKAL